MYIYSALVMRICDSSKQFPLVYYFLYCHRQTVLGRGILSTKCSAFYFAFREMNISSAFFYKRKSFLHKHFLCLNSYHCFKKLFSVYRITTKTSLLKKKASIYQKVQY